MIFYVKFEVIQFLGNSTSHKIIEFQPFKILFENNLTS